MSDGKPAPDPDLWCIVYGCLTVGVSDSGLTLYIAPARTLKLIDISLEDLPCIVNF